MKHYEKQTFQLRSLIFICQQTATQAATLGMQLHFFFFLLINLSQVSHLIQDDAIKAVRELTVTLLALEKLPKSIKIKDQKGCSAKTSFIKAVLELNTHSMYYLSRLIYLHKHFLQKTSCQTGT